MASVVSDQQGVRSNQWQFLYLLSYINAHNSGRWPIVWGRGTAQEGEADRSGGAWPSDSVAAVFGEE
jgi:hypothetical protein